MTETNTALKTDSIQYIAHCWIPMSDGIRLSASLWLPPADSGRVPAIVEIHPYRKRDLYYERDHQMCSYFAEQGIAAVRIDMRGHGDSEGLHDAYRTYQDCEEVLAWLRTQAWCSGELGMMGLSWGGTNAFMSAARQAPGLKAILTNASSHDRYGVGMLWKNGCLLNENFCWVTAISAFATRPPDPQVVGEGWRDMWVDRLEKHEPELRHLFEHQRRDAYWDEHTAQGIENSAVAMYMTAGMADNNYAQTPPALLPTLASEAACLLGPWGHKYPHQARPGPAIDFLGQAARWFDRHLRGNRSVQAPPPLTIFMAHDAPAQADYAQAQGRWVALAQLPAAEAPARIYQLGLGSLQDDMAPEAQSLRHSSPPDTGSASGEVMPWFAFGPGPELPSDQRVDDGKSLCFDSAVLAEDLQYLGAPALTLELSVDKPVAMLAVRLCDVKPDGASSRVSLGLFNLNQREEVGGSDREPRMLEPGRVYRLTLPMDFGAYRFLAGHRIRLAISTAYWPIVWASPEAAEITVRLAGSSLRLPLHQQANELASPVFDAPPVRPGAAKTVEKAPSERRTARHDFGTGVSELEIALSNGPFRLHDIDWTVSSQCREVYRIANDDPSAASVQIAWEWRFSRGPWSATTRVTSELTSDKKSFHAALSVQAYENDEKVHEKSWRKEIKRDHI